MKKISWNFVYSQATQCKSPFILPIFLQKKNSKLYDRRHLTVILSYIIYGFFKHCVLWVVPIHWPTQINEKHKTDKTEKYAPKADISPDYSHECIMQ